MLAPDEPWQYKLKLSEQAVKTSTPGILQVRRFRQDGDFLADMIYDLELGDGPPAVVVDPADPTRRKPIPANTPYEDLLVPVFRQGRLVYKNPPLEDVRRRTGEQLSALHPTIRRLINPHSYPAGLELGLHEMKMRMILEARGISENPGVSGG